MKTYYKYINIFPCLYISKLSSVLPNHPTGKILLKVHIIKRQTTLTFTLFMLYRINTHFTNTPYRLLRLDVLHYAIPSRFNDIGERLWKHLFFLHCKTYIQRTSSGPNSFPWSQCCRTFVPPKTSRAFPSSQQHQCH